MNTFLVTIACISFCLMEATKYKSDPDAFISLHQLSVFGLSYLFIDCKYTGAP